MIYIFICIWVLFWIRLCFIWESCSFFSEYFSWLIRGGVRGSGQLGHIHFWWVVIIKSDKPSLTFPSWQSLNEEEEGFSKFPLGFAKKKKIHLYILFMWQLTSISVWTSTFPSAFFSFLPISRNADFNLCSCLFVLPSVSPSCYG